jgi:hypothetical protein
MGEKEAQGAEVKDLTSTSFGYVIGFVLPGFLGLYALSFWSADVAHLLEPALKAEATVGPSLILILVALGVGVCVSALRFYAFEKLLCRKHHFAPDMFAKLTKENRLTTFRTVVDEHYRYHQFYGGCAVSLPTLYVGWFRRTWTLNRDVIWITLVFLILELVLSKAAMDTFEKYIVRGKFIVGG